MILYTPLSQADIFPENSNDYSKRQCVSYQGKLLFVEEVDKGSYELLQLLSTDPQDFLDKKYSPGNIFM
jgi:hypothetical protein